MTTAQSLKKEIQQQKFEYLLLESSVSFQSFHTMPKDKQLDLLSHVDNGLKDALLNRLEITDKAQSSLDDMTRIIENQKFAADEQIEMAIKALLIKMQNFIRQLVGAELVEAYQPPDLSRGAAQELNKKHGANWHERARSAESLLEKNDILHNKWLKNKTLMVDEDHSIEQIFNKNDSNSKSVKVPFSSKYVSIDDQSLMNTIDKKQSPADKAIESFGLNKVVAPTHLLMDVDTDFSNLISSKSPKLSNSHFDVIDRRFGAFENGNIDSVKVSIPLSTKVNAHMRSLTRKFDQIKDREDSIRNDPRIRDQIESIKMLSEAAKRGDRGSIESLKDLSVSDVLEGHPELISTVKGLQQDRRSLIFETGIFVERNRDNLSTESLQDSKNSIADIDTGLCTSSTNENEEMDLDRLLSKLDALLTQSSSPAPDVNDFTSSADNPNNPVTHPGYHKPEIAHRPS